MQNEPFNRFDALRLVAAVVLCAAAACAFYFKECAAPANSKKITISITKTPLVAFVDGDANSQPSPTNPTTSEEAAPIEFNLPASDVQEVLIDLVSANNAPTIDENGGVATELSPEANEKVPEIDIKLDTVKRQRDGALHVLIYHTHTEEAYTQTEQYTYVPHGNFHTVNNKRNVVAVGDELARLLTERYGMVVTHDTTDHEPPNYDTAYTRSLQTLKEYTDRGETFDIYIDLHRDSYARKHAENYVTIGGVKVARIMMVIGKGGAYAQKPDWQQNLKLAQALTDRLNAVTPTLCDKVKISDVNRYNQHISPNALLIEVGNEQNTLEEALAAMPYLAEAIDIVMGD